MTNKLVAIINSLKVPKIKKILLYEMKFLVPNYSCLQNPWLGGYRPQIPVLSVLCPQLNLLNPSPNKISGYATVRQHQSPSETETQMTQTLTVFSSGITLICSDQRNTSLVVERNVTDESLHPMSKNHHVFTTLSQFIKTLTHTDQQNTWIPVHREILAVKS